MRPQLLKSVFLASVSVLLLVSCEGLNEPILIPAPVPQSPENPQEEPSKNPGEYSELPDKPQDGGQQGGLSTVALSYQTISGNWITSRNYEYNSNGNVSKITWRSETPFVQTGSYTYSYDQYDKLTTVTSNHGDLEEYIWENGQVVRKNILSNGFISEYKIFSYNEQGLLATVAEYYLRHEAHYALRGINEFLYFTDGNLYTSMYYVYNTNSNSFELNSSKTYDNYIDAPNPFPMMEIIPGVVMQNKLPLNHTVTIGKQTINYSFSYEFRSDGYPITRTSSSEYGNEQTSYFYY